MTIEEFDNTNWGCGMTAKHKNYEGVYLIASCDFEERLIALSGITLGTDEPTWSRCENIELVK